MKPINARVTKALPVGTRISTCDNSGAKVIKIFSVKGSKTVKDSIIELQGNHVEKVKEELIKYGFPKDSISTQR